MSRHTFNPPDDELINCLNKKITGEDDLGAASEIKELNICHHEPAEIPALAMMPSSHTWHIISRVEKRKGKCQRTKRASRTGFWKVTGKKTMVKDVDGKIIGFKRYLGFKETKKRSSCSSSSFSSSSSTGRQPNKSVWIIHEFHSYIDHPNQDAFVLCKLIKNPGASPSGVVAEASPAATDPIITPLAMQNDDISVYDYDRVYSGVSEESFTAFQSMDLLDQPYYYHDVLQDLEIVENRDGF